MSTLYNRYYVKCIRTSEDGGKHWSYGTSYKGDLYAVNQDECNYTPVPEYIFSIGYKTEMEFDAEEKNITLTPLSTYLEKFVEYTISNPSDFITINGSSDKDITITESTKLALKIKSNSGEKREAQITFKQKDSNKEIVLTITQAKKVSPYVFTIDETAKKIGANATSFTLHVASTYNGSFLSYRVESNSGYFTINDTTTTSTTITSAEDITIFTEKNTSKTEARSATLTFTQTRSGDILYCDITQQPKDDNYHLEVENWISTWTEAEGVCSGFSVHSYYKDESQFVPYTIYGDTVWYFEPEVVSLHLPEFTIDGGKTYSSSMTISTKEESDKLALYMHQNDHKDARTVTVKIIQDTSYEEVDRGITQEGMNLDYTFSIPYTSKTINSLEQSLAFSVTSQHNSTFQPYIVYCDDDYASINGSVIAGTTGLTITSSDNLIIKVTQNEGTKWDIGNYRVVHLGFTQITTNRYKYSYITQEGYTFFIVPDSSIVGPASGSRFTTLTSTFGDELPELVMSSDSSWLTVSGKSTITIAPTTITTSFIPIEYTACLDNKSRTSKISIYPNSSFYSSMGTLYFNLTQKWKTDDTIDFQGYNGTFKYKWNGEEKSQYFSESSGSLDVSTFPTLTSCEEMFIETDIMSTLEKMCDMSFVTTCASMFDATNMSITGFTRLQDVHLENVGDTTKITDTSNMFKNCSALQNIYFTGWDFANVTDYDNMFQNCTSLHYVFIGDMSSSNCGWLMHRIQEAGHSTTWKLDIQAIEVYDTH